MASTMQNRGKKQQNESSDQSVEIKKLQSKISELEAVIVRLKRQRAPHKEQHDKQYDLIDEILDEVEENEEKYSHELRPKETKDNDTLDEEEDKKKPDQFWSDLEKKLKDGDIEHIKSLVKNKELKMDETDNIGRTLLMIAAQRGSFELVSMCINLGADIDKEDNAKQTALKIAKKNGYPDIEEILIMNQLKTELGQRIESTTKDISTKKGVTANFIRILNDIFSKQNNDFGDNIKRKAMSSRFLSLLAHALSQELLETLLSIMIESIKQRVAYSNDILHICFYYEIYIEKRAPTDTLLYQHIKHCVLNILKNTKNKKDWYWMKHYILNSSIWYFRIDTNDDKSLYLWYQIFEWVQNETILQSAELSKPMMMIENRNTQEWNKLIHYSINKGFSVRQDEIEGGLKSEYTKEYLTQNVSLSGSFNPFDHYDLSQYLTKLVLISHCANHRFQNDVQHIFDINCETKQNKELKLVYMRGPVKRLERCYAKVMSSYRDLTFPTAAHILDIVRCSLVFEDVSSMLLGMDLFQSKIADKKYCILQIVRIKNGFASYSHNNASYTDIKFNVMIKGNEFNVIGEIQFLFKRMFDYKKISHSLYSIERTKEFADGLSLVLPLKLDLKKQLFIHSARNNLLGLTDLMVAHNFGEEDLLQLNQSNQSILTPVCGLNCEKVFNYLVKAIPNSLLRERLLFPDHTKSYPLLRAIESNHYHGVLQTIFENDRFNLMNHKDQNRQTPLDLCWKNKKGKCALLILKNVKTNKERLKQIDYTGPETTSLQNALLTGDVGVVSFILDQLHADKELKSKLLKSIDSAKQTNFHYVAQGGSVECLQILLKHYDDKLREELWSLEDNNRTTSLFHAVINAKAEMTDYLLHQLNDKEKANFFDKPSLYGKMAIDELMLKKTKEHFDTLKIVVKHLAPNDKHLTKLFLIAAQTDELDLAKLLIDKTTDNIQKEMVLNYQNAATQSPLSESCIHNNTTFLEFLLNELDDDYKSFVFKSSNGRCALMEAASSCHLKACRLILNKISHKKKILYTVLSMKDSSQQTALVLAITAKNKNNEKCAKLILRHYDVQRDSEDIFLACLQLSDIEMAQAIWNNTKGNKELQNKLLSITDKEQYNCFLLVCKNGNYECLAWLLTLNDDSKNEAEEDEKNLMQKHQSSRKSPLLLCVANDIRKKTENDKQKVLTKEEKENYFKCTTLIFDKVTHARDLIFDKDNTKKNALHYACLNGNAQTVAFLLSKLSEKDQKKIIDEKDANFYNCFVFAVQGGNIELVQTIYDLYHKHNKLNQLTQNSVSLMMALKNGFEDITEWILFTLIKDTTQKLKYINANIDHSKSGRRFEEKIKTWITKILETEVKIVHDVRDVDKIFSWILKHQPIHLFCVKLILEKIAKDEYSKSTFIKQSKAISYSCQQNQSAVLQQLLVYLDDFTSPLFEGEKNSLIEAIAARSHKCVEMILDSIKNKDVKNRLIEACNTNNLNALMAAINIKSDSIIQVIFHHHSDIDCILGEAFIYALQQSNADFAKQLLDKANDRSTILNYRSEWGRSALNYASTQKTSDCLELIVEELKLEFERHQEDKKDHETEEVKEKQSNDIHPMYTETTQTGRNIFHFMFTSECTLKNIKIIESILSKKIIRHLLLSRCVQGSFLPIHYAIEKSPMDVVKWLISQFDDAPLQQFNMIAQRTEYNSSLVSMGIKDKAITTFLSKTLTKNLSQIDIKQIDVKVIKDIFYYTCHWECVELQQLIIDKVPKEQHPYLLNKDDVLVHWGHVLHECVRTDHEPLGKVILSTVTDIKQLMVRDSYGLYAMSRGMLQGSIKVMKLLLERFKHHDDLLMQQLNGCDAGGFKSFFYAWKYKRTECTMQVVSYLKEENIHIALNEACKHDKEFTIIPALLNVISNDDTKQKLLVQQNEKGENMLHVALTYNMRKVVEFFTKEFPDDIKDNEDSVFTATDSVKNSTPILNLATKADSYSAILAMILNRLSPKTRFKELLRRNYERSSVLSCIEGKKDMETICNKILCDVLESMNALDDVEMLYQLFEFCCASKNIRSLNMVLSKTAENVQNKLFMNYEDGRNWNIIKTLTSTDKDKKEMLFAVLKTIGRQQKLEILNDSKNPNNMRQNALIYCIQNADMECYNAILSEYDENKEDGDRLLKTYDEQYKTPLYLAVKSNKDDIAMDILKRIKDEIEIMAMLNRRTKDDETNIFDIISSSKIKNVLKKRISKVLENIKQNGLSSDKFFAYFKWLCKNNEIDHIKKLISTFIENDKHYLYNLLKYVSGSTKKSGLHVVAASNYYGLLEYFLSFINTDHQKREYLLFEDLHGNMPLLLSCSSDATECTQLLINSAKSNQQLLSEMILSKNSAHNTCIDYEITKTKTQDLHLILECSDNPLILKSLFITAMKKSKNEFAETVLQKAQSLNTPLFDHIDSDGCIPLYHALCTGNTKFAQIILNTIDKDNKATIDYLVEFKTYSGKSLLHGACHSTDINAAKLIMSIFQFQKSRNHLLFGTDDDGNLPLQIYCNTVHNTKCAEISEFVLWYLSNIKTNKEKLALLSHSNLSNVSTLNYPLFKNNKFGAFLFKRIVSSIVCGSENDISSWAKILEVAIAIPTDTLTIMKCIIHKYQHNRDHIIKLLSTNNHLSQNAFYNSSANCKSRSVLKYMTQFIDDKNNHLLIEPSLDGNTSLHKVVNDIVRGGMILKKFDLQNPTVLFKTNDSNKFILDQARSSAATLVLSKYINQQQLVQSFVDNVKDKKLWCYFLDHQEELMPKLLWARCSSNDSTWLMEVIWSANAARYLFKWTVDWIRRLSNDDQMKLLSSTNNGGQTALHYTMFHTNPEFLETILSLYPNQELKENALLLQDNSGTTPFHQSYTSNTTCVGSIVWKYVKNANDKLKIMNTLCKRWKTQVDQRGHNASKTWRELVKDVLIGMKDEYISDATLLIPFYYIAVTSNDIQFAKCIVSKINSKDSNSVMSFVTTKIPSMKNENCLHFAAYSKFNEFMQILINMIENIHYDTNKLLLDEQIICNKYQETPLSIACRKGHFYVVQYILQQINTKQNRIKLIEMIWKHELQKTKDNYKTKDEHQLGLNCITTCCLLKTFECLKELLSNYSDKDIKSIIRYKNNKKQRIYRFLKNVEISNYLKTKYFTSFPFGMSTFNEKDVDGMTPFMALVKYSAKLQLIEWTLNQCSNNEEKLQLIYNLNKDGENALCLTPIGSDQHLFLIQTLKKILSQFQTIKNIDTVVPIYLDSLRTGNLNLTKWLISLLNKNSDKKKLINCSNKYGLNGVLSSCKGGKMVSLQFLLSHKLFDKKLIFDKDQNGLTAIHYACYKDSISCLNTVLLLYKENGKNEFSELMFMKDKDGNIPFDHITRKQASSNLLKWIIGNCFSDIKDTIKMKRRRLEMLFANKNKKNEVSLIELMLRQNDIVITQCIKEYFDEIECIEEHDIEIVGHILMYLYKDHWNLSKYIISKITDKHILFKILNVENSDKYNLLLYVCQGSAVYIIDWLVDIIPDDHPILCKKENVTGKTAISFLMDRSHLTAAGSVLRKIIDNGHRLRLIQEKDIDNKSILDDAKEQNIPNRIDWMRKHFNKKL